MSLYELLEDHVAKCRICGDESLTGDAGKCTNFNRILADFQDE